MKLVVGFLTYNEASAKYLGDFLPSLTKALIFLPPSDYKILAFDNSDQNININRFALEFFFQKNPEQIEYHSTNNNIGFGKAYNFLIKRALELKADYFLMLNPDTILEEKSISNLLSKLVNNPDLSTVSPKILRWDFNNNKKTQQIDSCGLILKPGLNFSDLGQGEVDRGQYDKSFIIGPSGAAGLFRLKDLKAINDGDNYFDERFFMYKEDCDLAYRLYIKGKKSALEPEAVIYHDRTAAFYGRGLLAYLRNRRQLTKAVRIWSFKSQHLLFIKHFKNETFISRFKIVLKVIFLFFFSLILEQFNLKSYKDIKRYL